MTFSPHKVTRIIGAALRNTPAEKTTTSPVLAALQRRSTLTGIRLRHSLFTVKNSLPGPLHGDQLNYDNPVSSPLSLFPRPVCLNQPRRKLSSRGSRSGSASVAEEGASKHGHGSGAGRHLVAGKEGEKKRLVSI